MPKNSLINDLSEGAITLEQALCRLLVISLRLGDQKTVQWIKNEKDGYKSGVCVPDYRICPMTPVGDIKARNPMDPYIRQDVVLPTSCCTEEMREIINHYQVRLGISTIESMIQQIEDGKKKFAPIKPEYLYMFSQGLDNFTTISAKLRFSVGPLRCIIDTVKSRVLELLVMYEGSIGCLDDYDSVDLSQKDKDVINKVASDIVEGNRYEFNDCNFFGDKTKVKKSNVGKDNKIEKNVDAKLDTNINVTVPEKRRGLFSWLFRKK